MQLEVSNLTYKYESFVDDSKAAISNINLTIKENEFIGLIGHTGSGKSTLIQHFNALLKPTSGKVLFNGQDIWADNFDRRAFRGKVGLVFQYPEYQLFETTILKDVAFGPLNLSYSKQEAMSRAKEALAMVAIDEDLYNSSPFDLSGGQKRRVAIAGVLAMKPDILILDEPMAGLDPQGRKEILSCIKKLHKESANSIVLVSHSMDDVAEYVDRLLVINEGRIEMDASPKEIFKQVERLEEMGLAAPQISYIMRDLKEAGFEVDTSLITVEEAIEEIKKTLL